MITFVKKEGVSRTYDGVDGYAPTAAKGPLNGLQTLAPASWNSCGCLQPLNGAPTDS